MTYVRKMCVVTGTRAEYGLLYWLMKEIQTADNLELQVIVTGMHLSSEFGLTYQQIESDGFVIDEKVEMLLSSDSEVGIAKSMGLAMIGFADALERLNPDMMIVLGDRFEIFSCVSTATVAKIPIVHIHGGETTEGAYDESFRHSISKMSHLHFTSTDEYRRRVIQLGEQPDRVFNVGAIGIDNIKKMRLLDRTEFEKSIDFSLGNRNLLITFHPATLETGAAEEQFSSLLAVLDELDDTHLIFTKANADTGGRIINSMIDKYVATRETAVSFISLGRLRYLSAMQFVDGVVGNSSSGLIEAPSFKIGTVNIGDRQKGRVRALSIIDCEPTVKDIRGAITVLFSREFKKEIYGMESPYGEGLASYKIMKVIANISLSGVLKKHFFDISVQESIGSF